MPALVRYVLGWLAAATAAVLLAWQGVALVGTQVTDRRPSPLTPEQARQALEDRGETGSPPGADPGVSTPGPPAPSPPTSPTAPASSPTTTAASRPPATSRPTAPPVTTRAAPPAPQPPTPAQTRTYNLAGGSVALRFSPSGVSIVWANPNPGFEVDVDNAHQNGVRVRFESDSRRSEVEAWWEGGPRDQIREDGDDGRGED